MGAMKDAFLDKLYRLAPRSIWSFDKLLDAWEDWLDNGYRLTDGQPLHQPPGGPLLYQIEELGHLTGYPPNLLLDAWENKWVEGLDRDIPQEWDFFKRTILELDL